MIVGPPTTGKTELALTIARKLDGEVINADKFYLFKGFPSTTGLPDFSEYPDIPRHLYEILEPGEEALPTPEYVKRVRELEADIFLRDRLPIIEGCYHRFARALVEEDQRDPESFHLMIGIKWPSGLNLEERVVRRINEIFDIREGINEVKAALDKGYRETFVMRKGSIIRPTVEYLDGSIDLETAKKKAITGLLYAAYKSYSRFLDVPGITWYEYDEKNKEPLVEQIVLKISESNDSQTNAMYSSAPDSRFISRACSGVTNL